MKISVKTLSFLLAVCFVLLTAAGCGPAAGGDTSKGEESLVVHDFVADTKLDMDSFTAKQEVTVKSYIDGDTTHFYASESVDGEGVFKARYLSVNTPESTGKIEEWGKKASTFTKEKLLSADSIVIESDDDKWNADSTGDRYLVWVWYRPSGSQEYRNLNLELIQNGLSIACGTKDARYGDACVNAFMQAKAQKLHVFSGKQDPDFYYGDAYEIDLKGLRTNISLYDNTKVAFEGVVTRINNNSAYVEEYDEETGRYYGMAVYYGFATGELLNILKVGNRVRVVGTVTYYETGGTWQVSGLSYRAIKPNDPSNTQLISTGHNASNVVTDPETFVNGKAEVEVFASLDGEETVVQTFDYAALAMNTSVRFNDLVVTDIYTTQNGGDSDGAMTLTCDVNGIEITVRTIVFKKEDGSLYTEQDYMGKTIDVIGLVDYFSGEYQIKVFTPAEVIVH